MSNTLKRSRSTRINVPPLPELVGDIILEIFTHKSIQFDGPNHPEYGDNTRLAELGGQALQVAVTRTLFDLKEPMLSVDEIAIHREGLLSDDTIEHWVKVYGLKRKVRCLPDAIASLDTPEECRSLFNSYVGAVWVQHGAEVVQTWITKLIRPDWNEHDGSLERPNTAGRTDGSPPPKRIKNEPGYFNTWQGQIQAPVVPPRFSFSLPSFSSAAAAVAAPAAATAPPPPPPPPSAWQPPPSVPNYVASIRSAPMFLPMFNQAAAQRRVSVEYQTTFHGPPHAGKWHALCLVNGILKGEGNGSSKQAAKDEAARQAYYAMGWATISGV